MGIRQQKKSIHSIYWGSSLAITLLIIFAYLSVFFALQSISEDNHLIREMGVQRARGQCITKLSLLLLYGNSAEEEQWNSWVKELEQKKRDFMHSQQPPRQGIISNMAEFMGIGVVQHVSPLIDQAVGGLLEASSIALEARRGTGKEFDREQLRNSLLEAEAIYLGEMNALMEGSLSITRKTSNWLNGIAFIIACILMASQFFIGKFMVLPSISRMNRLKGLSEEKAAKLAATLEALNSTSIVSISDLKGTIIHANDMFCKIAGYTQEELIGRNHNIINSEQHPKSFWVEMWKTVSQGGVWQGEICNRAKDGSLYWVHTVISPIYDKQGRIKQYLSIRVLITERKRMEELLKREKELAEAASNAKSDFLANMSHEIRTPLNSVIGFSDLLQNTGLDSSQRKYVKYVNASANTLLELINDILDFSKIEAGKLELSMSRVDLPVMLEEVLNIVSYKANTKGLELILDISPETPRFIQADPLRLRQVIINLMGNALKFTSEGHIRLLVQSRGPWEQGRQLLQFTVEDTGIGIHTEKQRSIFEAFSQEDESTTRKYGGTGLGLSISNSLLMLMHSKLELSSVQGEGSCFYFSLEVGAAQESAFSIDPEQMEQLKDIEQLLVLDDHQPSREAIEKILEYHSIPYTLCSNGEEALAVCEQQKPDLAIIDYEMPYFNGVEVIRKLRLDLGLSADSLKIALCHNSVDDAELRAECQGLHVSRFVHKPLTAARLCKLLADLKSKELMEEAAAETVTLSGKQATILVVDDNEINRLLAQSLIKASLPHAQIEEACNGKEAVEAFFRVKPSLVLMDIQMPEMSGYEATRAIREQEAAGTQVPILALTAGTVKGEEEKCLAMGMDGYLSKPITQARLNEAMMEHLPDLADGVVLADAALEEESSEDLRHFNKEELLKRLGHKLGDLSGEYLVDEILGLVREGAIQRVLEKAYDLILVKAPADKIQSLAHTVKGAAQGSGLELLAAMAHRLELMDPFEYKHAERLMLEIKAEHEVILNLIGKAEIEGD